jgi:hypothetical protein
MSLPTTYLGLEDFILKGLSIYSFVKRESVKKDVGAASFAEEANVVVPSHQIM